MFSAQYVLDEILPLAMSSYPGMAAPAGWTVLAKIEPQDFGYLFKNGTTVAAVFCGTRTDDQWCHDFDALPIANPFGPGRVPRGAMQEYQMIRQSVWEALEKTSYEQLIIIGHSLGGWLADYCAADIAKNAPYYGTNYAARIIGYTFEGPKPGDAEFIDDFNKKFPAWWRIQNIRDPIPMQPPPPIYTEHEGTTIWIDGGHTMDVHVAHGLLSGVKPGLEKMAGGKA